MKNSIQYFTEKRIPELQKIKMNFIENLQHLEICGRNPADFSLNSTLLCLQIAERIQNPFWSATRKDANASI